MVSPSAPASPFWLNPTFRLNSTNAAPAPSSRSCRPSSSCQCALISPLFGATGPFSTSSTPAPFPSPSPSSCSSSMPYPSRLDGLWPETFKAAAPNTAPPCSFFPCSPPRYSSPSFFRVSASMEAFAKSTVTSAPKAFWRAPFASPFSGCSASSPPASFKAPHGCAAPRPPSGQKRRRPPPRI